MRNFEEIALRKRITSRGGGMLGSIRNDCTIIGWREDKELEDIAIELAEYMHLLRSAY